MIIELFDVDLIDAPPPVVYTEIELIGLKDRLLEKWGICPIIIFFYDHGTADNYGLLKFNTIDGSYTRVIFNKDFRIPANRPKKPSGYKLVQYFLKIWEVFPDAVIVTEQGTFGASGGFGNLETRYFLEYEMKKRNISKNQLREVDNRLVANESKAKGKGKKRGDKKLDKHTHYRDAELMCNAVLKRLERASPYNFNKRFYPKKRHHSVRPLDDDYNHPVVLMYAKTTYDINDPIWSEEFKKLCGRQTKNGYWVWHWEHLLSFFMSFEEIGVENIDYWLEIIIGAWEKGQPCFYRKGRDYLHIEQFKQEKGDDYFYLKEGKNGIKRKVKKKFTGDDWSSARKKVKTILREFHKNTYEYHIKNNIPMGENVKITIYEYYWGRYELRKHDTESYFNKYWKVSYPRTPPITFEEFYNSKLN